MIKEVESQKSGNSLSLEQNLNLLFAYTNLSKISVMFVDPTKHVDLLLRPLLEQLSANRDKEVDSQTCYKLDSVLCAIRHADSTIYERLSELAIYQHTKGLNHDLRFLALALKLCSSMSQEAQLRKTVDYVFERVLPSYPIEKHRQAYFQIAQTLSKWPSLLQEDPKLLK